MPKKYLKLIPALVILAVFVTGCETYRGAGSYQNPGAATGIGLGYTVGSEVGARADAARGYTPYTYGSSYYYRDPFYYRR